MDLYLQVGYGMQEHCRRLVEYWSGGTTILSPRDLKPQQMHRLSSELRDRGGTVIMDPQFYLPRSDHFRLTSYDYWPKDYDTVGFDGDARRTMIQQLAELNRQMGTQWLILPGERAATVSDLWLDSQHAFLQEGRGISHVPIMATVCLSADAIRSAEQVNLVVEAASQDLAPAYFVAAEPPGHSYLVDDPQWLANLLDLIAGLRLLGSKVVVGHSNHQLLVLAATGANAIASGTWQNVRSFTPNRYQNPREDDQRRRATWYYCPQALTEFTLPFLDIAVRRGLGTLLSPDPPTVFGSGLFQVPQPSASGWGELDAFRHYLHALRLQAHTVTCDSFDKTVTVHFRMLDRAEQLLRELQKVGITGQQRDFSSALDAN